MITFSKKILQNEAYKRITTNIISLFSLQGFSYILPLITFPYLTRVLGPENYGLLAFALAFIGYFQILTDYGFNLSATREISINRKNEENLSKIFNSVMACKLILLILSFTLMTLIVFSVDKFRDNWLLYFFTFGLVIGNLLMPTWFFQGIEKMKYISILNTGTLTIYAVSIFLFIRSPSDYIFVPLINSIGAITIGIIALIIIKRNFNVNFHLPTIRSIKYQLVEGWHVFISTVAISFYTISNVFILGFFASPIIVGYFAVANSIITMTSGLLTPISQSIYPHISSLAINSKESAIKFIKKMTLLIGIFSFVLSLLIFLFSGTILHILAGTQYNESILLLKIMAFLPFIIALSNIFGIQTMLTFNYKKAFSRIILIASAINIILALYLAPLYQDIGISFAVVISEIFVTVTMFSYLKRRGINLMEFKNVYYVLKKAHTILSNK
ncbi:MAG TPA: flippase [Methanobacterium sp.]|nr:flippase [Methanobacterium sp.]